MTADRDLLVRDEKGTIIQVVAQTEAGYEWLAEHTNAEPWQWMGRALCIDHRFARAVIEGAIADGLGVE